MKADAHEKKWLNDILYYLYLLFFFSLTFAFNFFSSLSIGLLILTGLIQNKFNLKFLFHPNSKNFFFFSCLLFYLFQFISLLYTENKTEAWIHLRIKSALFFVPLALSLTDHIIETKRKILLRFFVISLLIASLFCLVMNCWKYIQHQDMSVFFFHELTHPLSQHAVYFSIMVFIALVYLVENLSKKDFFFGMFFRILLILFFSGFLILLSSKLVLFFYIFYLLYFSITVLFSNKKNRLLPLVTIGACFIVATLIYITDNPVSKRFKEIFQTDLSLVKEKKYDQGIYFNDIQFRLVEWKLVTEILNESHSWWTGVGVGDGQISLDKMYVEKNMYTGDPVRGDRGFLGYNTHNQLLETLLQSGIPGVILFLLILYFLMRLTLGKRKRLLSFITLLLVIYSFNESVFEAQYAIILFTFFPVFLSLPEDQV